MARRKIRPNVAVRDEVPPEPRNRLLATRRLAPSDAVDRMNVTVNLAESPLAWLARRGLLNDAQVAAGERLRRDFLIGGHGPRTTMRWDAAPTGRGNADGWDPSSAQIAARRRFAEAVAAAGPGLSDVLWRVVCAGEGMETAERALGWPARAGRVVLTLALDRLATFYGLSRQTAAASDFVMD